MARVIVQCNDKHADDLVTYLNSSDDLVTYLNSEVGFQAAKINPNKDQAEEILQWLISCLHDGHLAGELTNLYSIADHLYNNLGDLLDYLAEVHKP